MKWKWWAFRDSNTGAADSGYQGFPPDLDYIIIHGITRWGIGRYWCIARRDQAASFAPQVPRRITPWA